MNGVPNFPYRVTRHHVEPGDKLVLYTDGLTERQGADDELFGLERLLEVIFRHGTNAPQALLDKIVEENRAFAGRSDSDDDLAVMVIEYLGPSRTPP